MGKLVQKYIDYLPQIEVTHEIKPVAQTILKVTLTITPVWTWTQRWHNNAESFFIIVDDEVEILHQETVRISKNNIIKRIPIESSFFVPFRDTKTRSYNLKGKGYNASGVGLLDRR